MQFCRQLLGVQKNTTNIGVLLELGRTPLVLDAQKAAIKNWERIKNSKANHLVIKSYENACTESLDWINNIQNLLGRNGMRNLFIENTPKNVHSKFYNRAKDIYHQESFSTILDVASKLRTYGLMKYKIGREDYLTEIRNTKLRSKLSKFRLSNHKLMIEIGRHMKLQIHERICQVCQKCVEDEVHFLINCEPYEAIRIPLFDYCTELKSRFPYYTDEEKFIFIMTSSHLAHNAAKFIDNALNIRDAYL